MTEFKMSVLGMAEVGKTSLLNTLAGKKFNRKDGHKPSNGEEAACFTYEVTTSAGVITFKLFDWAWAEKRRNESITSQLARGCDGSVFLYDVQSRMSLRDAGDFFSWYETAAGFEKPVLILSNKNDSKKVQVQEGEGQALAKSRKNSAYLAISLADGTGVDLVFQSLARLMMGDPNITVSKWKSV